MTPNFQFVLYDLDGAQLGEVYGATERTLSLPLTHIPTASFKIPLAHTLAQTLLDTDTILVVLYTDRNGSKSVVFSGPVMGVSEEADALDQTLAVAATGGVSILAHRVAGASKSGLFFSGGIGSPATGGVPIAILNHVNLAGYTGIEPGTSGGSTHTNAFTVRYRIALDAISEYQASTGDFEFYVAPMAPTNVGKAWPQIGTLHTPNAVGSDKSASVVLEYGTGRASIAEYQRVVSRDGLATKGYIAPGGWPDTPEDLVTATGAAAMAAHGLRETIVPDPALTDATLRQQLVDYHVAVRKNPRQLITFTTTRNAVPSPIMDYATGDYIRTRAVVGASVRFDTVLRVWGMTLSVDENGNVATDLELVIPA
jgi:hypothetical protein